MKGVYNQDWSYTSFDVSDNCIYLKWINLVGWCEKNILWFLSAFIMKRIIAAIHLIVGMKCFQTTLILIIGEFCK